MGPRRAFHEPDERADLFAQNAVLDLLVSQVRQVVDVNPELLDPLRARLAGLLPLEPTPARGICGAVAPAPSSEAAPKPPATTEPDAKPAELQAGTAPLPGDLDRLVSLANLEAYLKHHARTLRPGAFRDAVNVHAGFVNRELAIVRSRLENGNGGDRGAA
ncbi:MAG: hypothetical protein B7Y80_01680 [Hyphomicrobium sp. 32-62-53]|nr:MAG: hypothetical protein B7Z29_02030 [Hyphomicrobium sp. 12-62-95]OYY01465.1 MAG: hypothetical protein B7Y80_01680 [Hyphomicrobium sp. 32-62-53]